MKENYQLNQHSKQYMDFGVQVKLLFSS